MKFKFNGDQDCPDWVLVEMATLSRLTSVKTRILTSKVLQNLLVNADNNNEVLDNCSNIDANFMIGDVKAVIAVLSFILTASGKYLFDFDYTGSLIVLND